MKSQLKSQVKKDIARQVGFMVLSNRLLQPGFNTPRGQMTPHQRSYITFLKAVKRTRRDLQYAQPHLSHRARLDLAKHIVTALRGTPASAARRLA